MQILPSLLSTEGPYWGEAYNRVLNAAKLLFKERYIFADADNNTLLIKDRITILLSFSNNETKAYIYTYEGELKDKKENYKVRLLGTPPIVEYLEIKAKENDWLIDNEG